MINEYRKIQIAIIILTALVIFLLQGCVLFEYPNNSGHSYSFGTSTDSNPYVYSNTENNSTASVSVSDESGSDESGSLVSQISSQISGSESSPDVVSPTGGTITKIPGFDEVMYAKRIYELIFIFAIDSFESSSEISVSKMVQYTFTHLFHNTLVDMPFSEDMVYREANPDTINAGLVKHFVIPAGFNPTKSDLYNPNSNIYQMWELNYGRQIFYTIFSLSKSENYIDIEIAFYPDNSKTDSDAHVKVRLQKADNSYVYVNMRKK